MAQPEPVTEHLPSPSGTPLTALTWPDARTRLSDNETYLLATSSPAGRPHVVPLPGIWLEATPTLVFAFGKAKGFTATRWHS